MYVTHDPKTVYLANIRTASQAIARMLTEHYGAERPYGIEPAGIGTHHGYSPELLDKYREEGYVVWCVVRNALDWLISVGVKHNRITPDATQEEVERWLVEDFDEPWVNAMPEGPFSLYAELSDVVLRFRDLPDCLAGLGFDPDKLEHVDRSEGRRDAKDYFNDTAYDRAVEIFFVGS